MKNDLEIILERIKYDRPFALIRFGDGEENILNNVACKRQGFEFDPGDVRDQKFRRELEESLKYYSERKYYVGTNNFNLNVGGTVVSPAIFINQNYTIFLKKMIPVLQKSSIYLVAHEKSKLDTLPFMVEQFFPLKDNAWRHSSYLEDISSVASNFGEQPKVILVAGGPYSCVLIHQLWQLNKKHIYIDIGSTFDPFLFSSITRLYQKRLKRTIWENHYNLNIVKRIKDYE